MTRPTLPRLTMARALVFACLAATAGWSPAAVLAAEIAWQQVTKARTVTGDTIARSGTAKLSSGETATVKLDGRYGPKDKKGRATFKAKSQLEFADGSTIVTQYSGNVDPASYTHRGSGTFVSGTGRFAGIKGTVKFEGRMSDGEWKGTYTLPKKK